VRSRSLLLLALLAAPALARAGDDDAPAPSADLVPASDDLRTYITAQLDAQADVLAKTRTTVDQKRNDAAVARAHRAGIAYRLLRDGEGDRMATARRRAAARWVLARDRDEETLLADESTSLAEAAARLATDRTTAATIPLPPAIARPVAHAEIARHFGTFVHERSKAILSRRGVDFDCADHAPVHPVSDGVVTYAGPIRGLDEGLIIDHGGWLSVYGKLAAPTVKRGDHVTRADTVAHAARSRVYLEVRVAVGPGGVPVDPERLFE
jgi:septal ring factor EnvC (AmiA/AmiB activator)